MEEIHNINNFSSLIKKYRIKQNMSREKLSIKLMLEGFNISKQTIYKIENNKRKLKKEEIKILIKILKIVDK